MRALDNVREHCVSPIGSCTSTIGRALRKSCVLKVTDVWESAGYLAQQSRNEFFWKIKFAQCCQLQNSIVRQKFGVHTATLGRPSLCDPNLQSLFLSLRRSSARRSLRLLKTNPRPARPMKEPSVPALPAGKHKRVRPRGRPRAAGPIKAARRIHRLKTTLVPGPIPWLLRKAVADIDIVFGGGCTLREHGPRSNPGPLLFYGCEFASCEQPPGLPLISRTRETATPALPRQGRSLESLTSRPGIREQYRPTADIGTV
jgi:hypothetical protein